MSNELTTKGLFAAQSVQERFEKLLGTKAQGFITSVLQVVASSKALESADPNTVLTAAATAASLDLPINQSLGFAWIVPYKGQAQFQIGWKGLVQLALRTGQYKRINVIEVYDNQFKGFNALTENLDADFSIDGEGEVVGYAAYFQLLNGFEKMAYWSRVKVTNHAKKYSQAFNSKYSPWSDVDQFGAMAMKTVLKNTLSKYGIMSIEMQTAHIADQAVLNGNSVQYVDNVIDVEANSAAVEQARAIDFIGKATSMSELEIAVDGPEMTEDIQAAFDQKKVEFETEKA